MTHHTDEHDEHEGHRREKRGGGGFLSGMIFGGLIGAGLGLFLAPRSGKETMEMLRTRGEELRDQMNTGLDDARQSAEHLVTDVSAKVDTLQQRGRDMVLENKERIERTAAAVKETAKETWSETDRNRTYAG